MRALNIGSGQRRFDTTKGWINLDRTIRLPDQIPNVVADGMALPLNSGTFDCVVLHHVLEHFGCGEAAGLIREAYRVLRTGGSLYVFVPDLRALAARWIIGKLDTQIYLTNIYGAYQGREEDRHKWGFSKDSLASWLYDTCKWNTVGILQQPPLLAGSEIAWDFWILGIQCEK